MRYSSIVVTTDELGGKTFGECVEVAMARGAFWNVLTVDKLARPLFDSWGRRTGIVPAAASVSWLRRILSDRPGFSDIAVFRPSENPGFQSDKLRAADETPDAERAEDLHKALEFLAALGIDGEGETSQISTDALLAASAKGIDALRTKFDELGDVLPEAQAFVESINCPWPWLAAWMANSFRPAIETFVDGEDQDITLFVKEPPRREELPSFTIQPTPDESTPEYFKRLHHECAIHRQQVKALEEKNMPRGVIPAQGRMRTIERRMIWFYLHCFHECSIKSIAGKYADRRTVRDGIRKTEYLLELSP